MPSRAGWEPCSDLSLPRLPLEAGFDRVVSSVGAMFAADQQRTAAELVRFFRQERSVSAPVLVAGGRDRAVRDSSGTPHGGASGADDRRSLGMMPRAALVELFREAATGDGCRLALGYVIAVLDVAG